jgi:hypothetical protein
MAIPLYVNESKSDMRCIKPGWYAMGEDGSLSSGPFPSHEECVRRISKTISSDLRPEGDRT